MFEDNEIPFIISIISILLLLFLDKYGKGQIKIFIMILFLTEFSVLSFFFDKYPSIFSLPVLFLSLFLVIKNFHILSITKSDSSKSFSYNYLGYSVIRDLKYKISKNQIGKIINVEITMPQQGLSKRFYRNAKIWRKKELDLPTIQLDLFVHLLSITKYIFSGIKIKKLVANYQKSNNKLTHSSNVWAFSDKNIFFNLNCSKLKIGEKNNLSINIYGDKGAFKWSHNNPEILNYYNEFGKQIVLDRSHKEMKISREKRYNRYVMGHPSGFIEAMANYYHDIYSSIEQKKFSKDLINIKDEIFIFNTLESINKSALNSKWVYLKNT